MSPLEKDTGSYFCILLSSKGWFKIHFRVFKLKVYNFLSCLSTQETHLQMMLLLLRVSSRWCCCFSRWREDDVWCYFGCSHKKERSGSGMRAEVTSLDTSSDDVSSWCLWTCEDDCHDVDVVSKSLLDSMAAVSKALVADEDSEKDVAFNIKQETRGRSERNGAESEGKLSEGWEREVRGKHHEE